MNPVYWKVVHLDTPHGALANQCQRCGALVAPGGTFLHEQWHREVGK